MGVQKSQSIWAVGQNEPGRRQSGNSGDVNAMDQRQWSGANGLGMDRGRERGFVFNSGSFIQRQPADGGQDAAAD